MEAALRRSMLSGTALSWIGGSLDLMPNPHINVFRPYEGSGDGHEDRLTRAALVLMRLIPLAEDAFLRLVAGIGLADVGTRGRFDTQTARLVEAKDESDAEIERIVSVFLSPDAHHDDVEKVDVVLDERGQRIDGTVRYEHSLVIAIESKLHLGQSDRQARHLSPDGMAAAAIDPVRYLAWHDLLERWLSLRDAGVLSPTEEVIMDDFFEMAERHFSALLPFTTLARAGENDDRRRRRLRAILEGATGITAEDSHDPRVMLDGHAVSIQRAVVDRDGDLLRLAVWPAEQKPQALHIYEHPDRIARLCALSADGFDVSPNPHLAFRWSTPSERMSLDWERSAEDYLKFWSFEDGLAHIRQYTTEKARSELWPWLVHHGFAQPTDQPELELLLEAAGRRPIAVRPGVQVSRTWKYQDAVQLDADGEGLILQIRDALNSFMSSVDERPFPVS